MLGLMVSQLLLLLKLLQAYLLHILYICSISLHMMTRLGQIAVVVHTFVRYRSQVAIVNVISAKLIKVLLLEVAVADESGHKLAGRVDEHYVEYGLG